MLCCRLGRQRCGEMPFWGGFGKWGLGVGVMDFEVGGTMFLGVWRK